METDSQSTHPSRRLFTIAAASTAASWIMTACGPKRRTNRGGQVRPRCGDDQGARLLRQCPCDQWDTGPPTHRRDRRQIF